VNPENSETFEDTDSSLGKIETRATTPTMPTLVAIGSDRSFGQLIEKKSNFCH
jgi:hypothetical protein